MSVDNQSGNPINRGRALLFLLLCVVAVGALLFFCTTNPAAPDTPLSLTVRGDSVVMIHDSLILHASVPDAAARGVRYLWRLDQSQSGDTTSDSSITMVFSAVDTGNHLAIVQAFDRNDHLSPLDSFRFRVTYIQPSMTLLADTNAVVGASYTVRFITQRGVSPLDRWFWYRNDPTAVAATVDTQVSWTWAAADTGTHCIVAWAVDHDGIKSNPCSLTVRVSAILPRAHITADSIGIVGVPFSISITATPGVNPIERFEWYRDSLLTVTTSIDTVLSWTWNLSDTGNHRILVRAIDRDSLWSVPCTLLVRVITQPPEVTISADSTAYAGISWTAAFSATPGAGPIERFEWFFDSQANARTTIDTILARTWTIADTGTRLFAVRAFDRNGVYSQPDSLLVRVTYTRPRFTPLPDTSVKINDGITLTFSAADSLLPIIRFAYTLDDSGTPRFTTDSVIRLSWRVADTGQHLLVVQAYNSLLVASDPDTAVISVTSSRPHTSLVCDSTAAVNDTVVFTAQASDSDGTIVDYRWSVDSQPWVTTQTPSLHWHVPLNAAGTHRVRLFVIDDDGLVSDTVQAIVMVSLMRPTVSLPIRDTAILANQPCRLTAQAFDTNGTIAHYRWWLDGRTVAQFSDSSSAVFLFAPEESGSHLITCTVIDDDALESLPDSTLIRVLSGPPVISAMNDTAISSHDSLLLSCTASDPNGTIVRYLWDTQGSGWNDSTTAPNFVLRYDGRQIVRILVAARDNDGLIAVDTIQVTFNRPPDTIQVRKPLLPEDTCWLSLTTPSHSLVFEYAAIDPDNDSLRYTLSWGATLDSLAQAYQGNSRTCTLTCADEGVYYWQLDVRDTWGHTQSRSGKFVVMREYRICFIGHSIVAGFGGDNVVGGFRGTVLDSLRTLLSPTSRLRAVGPTTTLHMSRSAADDSCLAVSGITAKENYLLLASGASSLKADIWVFMIGANDAFINYECRRYTTMIMDEMISRNSAARIYVCNSPPLSSGFPTHNTYLPGFNQFLEDTVAARSSQGAHMFLVDAFSALTINDQYNQVWYNTDGIHPNQTGYDRLAATIISAMKGSDPPAVLVRP
ncbi:MAG: PKD domain-containing protein [Chitinispirillaceae bacterium]|nr:PKD domain-containing protein [Chitinispirillaceae bacterium]